jgi:prophage DNA circulation protein
VWVGVGAVLAFVLLWAGVASYGASRYAAGRASVVAATQPATVVSVVRAADSTAKAATDTVVRRVLVTRWKVDTLLRQVPDSLIAVPAIKSLASSVKQLTAQVDTLARTLDVERAVSRLRAATDSAALVSAAHTIAAKEDQIVSLKKRPQWRTVVTVGALGVVAGLLR